MGNNELTFRIAQEHEVPLILYFIKELAEYEKMSDEVEATEELLHQWIFEEKRGEVLFGEYEGETVGFALFFHNFSTFVGKKGLYLEDLYVKPEYRGKGFGKAFLLKLVSIAKERNCGRMEWVCLNWNKPSIDFYHSLGAVAMDEWSTYRLDDGAMSALLEKYNM